MLIAVRCDGITDIILLALCYGSQISGLIAMPSVGIAPHNRKCAPLIRTPKCNNHGSKCCGGTAVLCVQKNRPLEMWNANATKIDTFSTNVYLYGKTSKRKKKSEKSKKYEIFIKIRKFHKTYEIFIKNMKFS